MIALPHRLTCVLVLIGIVNIFFNFPLKVTASVGWPPCRKMW